MEIQNATMSGKNSGIEEFVHISPPQLQKPKNSFSCLEVKMLQNDSSAKIKVQEINGGMSPGYKESIMAFAVSEEDIPERFVPTKIVWNNVLGFGLLHIAAVIGLVLAITSAQWKTIFFTITVYIASLTGVTAGGHRLWSHRAYKAKLPLRILLAFLMTITYQMDIYWWSRDHRVHHKFTETNADPYSVNRGLFFAHIGWLLARKHPDVIEKGKTVDTSDLLADPVVAFQRKYYWWLLGLCCFVLPTVLPNILWGENIFNSGFIAVGLRLFLTFHATFTVNSIAHAYGHRPYNKGTEARDNIRMNFYALGEGFHNYHHTFPWDYAASEFGTYFSSSTVFINLMSWCGLAYDLRTVAPEVIQRKKKKIQDGNGQQQLKSVSPKSN